MNSDHIRKELESGRDFSTPTEPDSPASSLLENRSRVVPGCEWDPVRQSVH
jgi:hypothetical protein